MNFKDKVKAAYNVIAKSKLLNNKYKKWILAGLMFILLGTSGYEVFMNYSQEASGIVDVITSLVFSNDSTATAIDTLKEITTLDSGIVVDTLKDTIQ